MFEGLLENVLTQHLGRFIAFDSESLKVGIWSGKIELRNIALKPDALDGLEMPLQVKLGVIGSLSIAIPWSNLWKAPVTVDIDGIFIVATRVDGQTGHFSHEDAKKFARRNKQSQIKGAQQMKELHQLGESSKNKASMIQRLTETILNNLQLSIKNVHVRFEGQTIPGFEASKFSAGFVVSKISAFTTDASGVLKFQSNLETKQCHKILRIEHAALYLDPKMEWIHSLPNAVKLLKLSCDPKKQNTQGHQFIVKPFEATLKVSLNNDPLVTSLPKAAIGVKLENFYVALSCRQYHIIMDILNRFSEMKIRSDVAVSFLKISDNVCTMDKENLSRARGRWKFAITCVRAYLHHKKRVNLSWKFVGKQIRWRKSYMVLYGKALRGLIRIDDHRILDLEDILELEAVMIYRKLVEVELHEEKKKRQTSEKGLFSYLFGGSKSDEEKMLESAGLSEDERAEIFRTFDLASAAAELKVDPTSKLIELEADFGRISLSLNRGEGSLTEAVISSTLNVQLFANGASNFDFQMHDFRVFSHLSISINTIICQPFDLNKLSSTKSFLSVKMKIFAPDSKNRCKSSIVVSGNSGIVWDYEKKWIEELVRFFTQPPSIDDHVTDEHSDRDFLSITAETWQLKQKAKFLQALNDHPFVRIDVSFQDLFLRIPELNARSCLVLMARSINIFTFTANCPNAKLVLDKQSLCPSNQLSDYYDGIQFQLNECSLSFVSSRTELSSRPIQDDDILLDRLSLSLTIFTLLSGDVPIALSSEASKILIDTRLNDVHCSVTLTNLERCLRLFEDMSPDFGDRSGQPDIPELETLHIEEFDSLSSLATGNALDFQILLDSISFDLVGEYDRLSSSSLVPVPSTSESKFALITLQIKRSLGALRMKHNEISGKFLLESFCVLDQLTGVQGNKESSSFFVSSLGNDDMQSNTLLTVYFRHRLGGLLDTGKTTSIAFDVNTLCLAWRPLSLKLLIPYLSLINFSTRAQNSDDPSSPEQRKTESFAERESFSLGLDGSLKTLVITLYSCSEEPVSLFCGHLDTFSFRIDLHQDKYEVSTRMEILRMLNMRLPPDSMHHILIGPREVENGNCPMIDARFCMFNRKSSSSEDIDADIFLRVKSIKVTLFRPLIEDLVNYVSGSIISLVLVEDSDKVLRKDEPKVSRSPQFLKLDVGIESPFMVFPDRLAMDANSLVEELLIGLGNFSINSNLVKVNGKKTERFRVSVENPSCFIQAISFPILNHADISAEIDRNFGRDGNAHLSVNVLSEKCTDVSISKMHVSALLSICSSNFLKSSQTINPELQPNVPHQVSGSSPRPSKSEKSEGTLLSLKYHFPGIKVDIFVPEKDDLSAIACLHLNSFEGNISSDAKSLKLELSMGSVSIKDCRSSRKRDVPQYLIFPNELFAEVENVEKKPSKQFNLSLNANLFENDSNAVLEVADINLLLHPEFIVEISNFFLQSLADAKQKLPPFEVQEKLDERLPSKESLSRFKIIASGLRIILPNSQVPVDSHLRYFVLFTHCQLDCVKDVAEECSKNKATLVFGDVQSFFSKSENVFSDQSTFLLSPTTFSVSLFTCLERGSFASKIFIDFHPLKLTLHWRALRALSFLFEEFDATLRRIQFPKNPDNIDTVFSELSPEEIIQRSKSLTEISVSSEGLVLHIIDDCSRKTLPFLSIILMELSPRIELLEDAMEFHLSTQFHILFFNPVNAQWEPVIEPSELSANLARVNVGSVGTGIAKYSTAVKARLSGISEQPRNDKDDRNCEYYTVNVNFSTAFWNQTQKVLTAWGRDAKQDKWVQNASNESLSSCVVRNSCGIDVNLSLSAEQKMRLIKSGDQISIDLADSFDIFGHGSEKTVDIAPCNEQWEPLRNISVSKIGKHTFTTGSSLSNTSPPICIEVFMRDGIKIISLSSSVIINNFSTSSLDIKIEPGSASSILDLSLISQDRETVESISDSQCILHPLASGNRTSVPLLLSDWNQISFRPSADFSWSSHVWTDLHVDDSGESLTLQCRAKTRQTSISRYYTVQSNLFNEVLNIDLFDPIQFRNSLSCDIALGLEDGNEIIVKSGADVSLVHWDPRNSDLGIFIKTPGFDPLHKRIRIIPGSKEPAHFKGDLGKELLVFLVVNKNLENSGAPFVTLFASFFVLDKTGLDLKIGVSRLPDRAFKCVNPQSDSSILESVWENERSNLFSWKPPFLPLDPPKFQSSSFENIEHLHDILLPENFQWIDHDWLLERDNETDANGWQYAFDFGKKFSNSGGAMSHVRRRKWVRNRLFGGKDHTSVSMLGVLEEQNYFLACKKGEEQWGSSISLVAASMEGGLRVPGGSSQVFDIASRIELAPGQYSLTRVISLHPRFFLVNDTERIVKVLEQGSNSTIDLPVGHKDPFYFSSSNSERLIRIQYATSETSVAFGIEKLGEMFLSCDSTQIEERVFFRIVITPLESSIVVLIAACSPYDVNQKVDNRTSMNVSIRQKTRPGLPKHDFAAKTSGPFTWDDFSGGSSMSVILYIGSTPCTGSFDFDSVGANMIVNCGSTAFRVLTLVEGSAKVLRIQPRTDPIPKIMSSQEAEEKSPIDFEFHLEVPRFGLSVINHRPLEILYIFTEDTSIVFTRSALARKCSLSVGRLQIDNPDLSYSTAFPAIIATPVPYKHPFFQFRAFENTGNEAVSCFQYVGLLLQQFSVNIDDRFILTLLDFLSESTTFTKDTVLPPGSLKDMLEIDDIDISALLDDVRSRLDSEKKLFFDVLEIYPLKFLLNLSSSGNLVSGMSVQFAPLQTFLKTLGALALNLHDSRFSFSGKKLQKAYLSREMLVQNLIGHFSHQYLSLSLNALGSAQILGNPIGLFYNVGSGVSDFFSEPAEGFMKGPAHFGMGIAKGSSSLLAHSVKGIGDSVTGITGTIGGVLAGLSFDEEYVARRELRKRRSNAANPVHGTLNAGRNLGEGVYHGLTGFVTAPVRGAQRSGIGGFFRGCAQGTIGLAVKPITGIVDATTSLVQGLQNVVGDDKKFSSVWIREPRMIYSTDRSIRVYNANDASVNKLIQSGIKNVQSLRKSDGAFEFFASVSKHRILIAFSNKLVFVKLKGGLPVKWRFRWQGKHESLPSLTILEIQVEHRDSDIIIHHQTETKVLKFPDSEAAALVYARLYRFGKERK